MPVMVASNDSFICERLFISQNENQLNNSNNNNAIFYRVIQSAINIAAIKRSPVTCCLYYSFIEDTVLYELSNSFF